MSDFDAINQEDIVSVTSARLDVLKIAFAKRKLCQCYEPRYELDIQNRLVWCRDCGAIVDPFEALRQIAWQHERINKLHERMLEERRSVVGYEPRLLVMRDLSKMYARGLKENLVPRCPNCREPFELPELIGGTWCNKAYLKPKEQEDSDE